MKSEASQDVRLVTSWFNSIYGVFFFSVVRFATLCSSLQVGGVGNYFSVRIFPWRCQDIYGPINPKINCASPAKSDMFYEGLATLQSLLCIQLGVTGQTGALITLSSTERDPFLRG